MELPPYRRPTAKAILKHTWFKGEQYLKKISTIILAASMIIWFLGAFPRNKSIREDFEQQRQQLNQEHTTAVGNSNIDEQETLRSAHAKKIAHLNYQEVKVLQEKSFIGQIGRFMEPAIRPLGFDWRMGISLLAGSSAKEVVISTLGVLYQADPDDIEGQALSNKLKTNTYQEGNKAGERVFNPLVALSFMVFVLIYFPCIAVIATVRKESGRWRWALFLAFYSTILAWLTSWIIYQGGTFLLG
jgi:ferrous iron transport protein B